MPVVPSELLAAVARAAMERHDDWDSLASFVTVHWKPGDAEARLGTYGALAVPPEEYPKFMGLLALGAVKDYPDDPPVAYLVQVEAYVRNAPPAGAPADERAAYDWRREQRRFDLDPEAVEVATAWCADVYGRLWRSMKKRAEPGVITDEYWPATKATPLIGGPVGESLMILALATGVRCHGVPASSLPPWAAAGLLGF